MSQDVAASGSPENAGMVSAKVRHPCPKCGYDLRGLPYFGKGRSCPECGTTTSDEDLRRLRLIPPVGRALAWMCVPVFVAAGAVWIIGATRWSLPGGPFAAKLRLVQFVLMGALVMWALVVPPVIATRRSARCGRSPMGTVDETILGYALNLGVPVLAIFISLLVKMILSR